MNHLRPALFLLTALLAVLPLACRKAPDKSAPALESADQRVSYGIGHNIGSGLARDKVITVDFAALQAGLQDGLAGTPLRVAEGDLDAAFAAVQQRMAAESAAAAEKQLAAGAEFLRQNQARAGVNVTASGLQYEVLKSGTGAKPTTRDRVRVHYHGTLTNGQVFDSSVERGEPVEFPVTGVIQGWVEALQLMAVGDKWKLTIPSNLAYGGRAAGDIPPNSVLVFEVELLDIVAPPAPPATPAATP